MASRWEKLALTAHVRGCLDFREPHRFDWRWRLKEELILDTMEDELATEVNRLAHLWHCSAAQVTGWDDKEELFNHHSKQVHQAYNLIGKSLLPWYKQWSAEEKSLAQLWREMMEEEKDPAYAQLLREEREKLLAKVKEAEQSEADLAARIRALDERKVKEAQTQKERQERANRARLRYEQAKPRR